MVVTFCMRWGSCLLMSRTGLVWWEVVWSGGFVAWRVQVYLRECEYEQAGGRRVMRRWCGSPASPCRL